MIPHGYNLLYNLCVNKEIKRTNVKMKILCYSYFKFSILDIGKMDRNLYTNMV